VIRLRGELTMTPESFVGVAARYAIASEATEALPPFRSALRLGTPSAVTSGSALLVLGWPSPHGQTSIFVDSTHECLSREGQLLHTRAFIHAGSSGGPALTPSLHVVGVVSHNPRSSDDTIRPPEAGGEVHYLACIRSTERIGLIAPAATDLISCRRAPAVLPPPPPA
ncbi:hypothetical protein EMIHUDRAFT_368946, partial [Emiliania huxleyi CCMP1516]|uniref:Serine protease n=2 Tax=Emiliania huxleyi TaxID=2903 RepID=A0A0D3I0S6_EMIH1